jgi:hypothetical protein
MGVLKRGRKAPLIAKIPLSLGRGARGEGINQFFK